MKKSEMGSVAIIVLVVILIAASTTLVGGVRPKISSKNLIGNAVTIIQEQTSSENRTLQLRAVSFEAVSPTQEPIQTPTERPTFTPSPTRTIPTSRPTQTPTPTPISCQPQGQLCGYGPAWICCSGLICANNVCVAPTPIPTRTPPTRAPSPTQPLLL